MANASNSITIDRPAAEVYRFLADGLNNPKWRSAVVEIKLASGSGWAVGAVYKQTMKGPMGRTVDGSYRIAEAMPNSRIRFEVIAGPARPVGMFEIEPAGNGARVRFSLSVEPRGIMMRLMNGMIQSAMNGEVENLAALKRALEGS